MRDLERDVLAQVAHLAVDADADDAGLAHKLAVLERAAARSKATAPIDVLAEFGGCEIAMMAGAMIGGAAARTYWMRPVAV